MNIKKIVLRTVPYVCIALYGTKIGQAWRLAAGTAFAEKFLHWGDGFMQAFESPHFRVFIRRICWQAWR